MPRKIISGHPEQLQLFPESEIDHIKKERIVKILRSELAAPVDVALTENRSSILSSRKKSGQFEVRMHRVFLQADRRVIKAVADLIKRGSKPARVIINDYIKSHQRQIQSDRASRVLVLYPKGKAYDLEQIINNIARRYKLSRRGVRVTWSSSKIRRGQQTIRLGSYNHDEKLIRVHSSLDSLKVPRYFVEYIVYHELLHARIPPQSKSGRRDFHPGEYHQLEQRFERFKDARKFEKYITSRWLH